jgi:acyl-CoA thioester hydrolase
MAVNAPARDAAPNLDDFPFRQTDNVRFADLDPNQHVNNAVYASYFETGRVSLVKDEANGLMPPGLNWVLVRLDIHFRAELHWPGTIEMGTGVVELGRSSVRFDQVVFSQGRCMASARAITVLVDGATRKPAAMPEETRANMRRWALRGVTP